MLTSLDEFIYSEEYATITTLRNMLSFIFAVGAGDEKEINKQSDQLLADLSTVVFRAHEDFEFNKAKILLQFFSSTDADSNLLLGLLATCMPKIEKIYEGTDTLPYIFVRSVKTELLLRAGLSEMDAIGFGFQQ